VTGGDRTVELACTIHHRSQQLLSRSGGDTVEPSRLGCRHWTVLYWIWVRTPAWSHEAMLRYQHLICNKLANVWSGAFTANEYNKNFSGYQPSQVVEWRKKRRFEDHLRPRPQGTEVHVLKSSQEINFVTSVPWGPGRRWSSTRWFFRHSTTWRGW
jgi:hypothetical protein